MTIEQVEALVVGGGQAGIAMSEHLGLCGVPHLVLERHRIAERWPQVRCAMAHRVGRLAIGDPAVMIAAAGPHRPEAFEACRFAIDTLKETVPIWKKEFATSGSYWVEENP